MNYALVISDRQNDPNIYLGRCRTAVELLRRKEVGAIILASAETTREAVLRLTHKGVSIHDIINMPQCHTQQEEFELGKAFIQNLGPGHSLHLVTRVPDGQMGPTPRPRERETGLKKRSLARRARR